MIRFLPTLLASLAGGTAFALIDAPLPWLLGPMAFSLIGARVLTKFNAKPLWPIFLRDTAMIAIGYSIGLTFTPETLAEMGRQLPTMVLMTTLLLAFCAGIGIVVAKLSGQHLPTVLMGSVPGGLSQMLVLGESTPGVDLTVMTFLQVSRLLMIIFCVPLLVFNTPLFGVAKVEIEAAATRTSAHWGDLYPNIFLFAIICVAAAWLAKRIRMPLLLGPMIATAVVHLSGVDAPALPTEALDVAQLLIGTYVGLLLRPEGMKNKATMTLLAIVSGIVLLAGSFGLSELLTHLHAISPETAFLGMAPGGMDQMGLIANEIDADIAVVTCYQLFRTWVIFFAVPPLLRLAFKRWNARSSAPSGENGLPGR